MKKLYRIILVGLFLLTLVGCGESKLPDGTNTEPLPETAVPPETEQHTDPHLANFRDVLGDGDFCAVSHLGYLDGSYDEILSHIKALGVPEAFPFLEIAEENYVGLAGGEVYAIVPADADAVVTVYSAVLDEVNYTVKADKQLAEFTGGVPILLKCNVSEIMPNAVLEITAKGQKHTYSPSLSGENGKLVQTEGVYDFSPYDVLFAGIADGAEFVFCDKWLTSEPDRAGNPLTLLLNLMPDGGAEYACGPADSEFIDAYAGTWSYDTQKEMIFLTLEEVRADEDTSPDRPLHTLNCGFTWEIDGSVLQLTHTEGDEILDGSWGGTFRFMNGFDFYNEPKG